MRTSFILVLLPALAGAILGSLAYFTQNTGVDGTVGALLALIGAAAVAIGALLAMVPGVRGGFLKFLNLLLGLGALLTAVAAYFLMQYYFAAAMGLALLGLVAATAAHSRRPV